MKFFYFFVYILSLYSLSALAMNGYTRSYRQGDQLIVIASDQNNIAIDLTSTQFILLCPGKEFDCSITLMTNIENLRLFANWLEMLNKRCHGDIKENIFQYMNTQSIDSLFYLTGLAEITNVFRHYQDELRTVILNRISELLYNNFNFDTLQNRYEGQIVRGMVISKLNSLLDMSVACDLTKNGILKPFCFNNDITGVYISSDAINKSLVWENDKDGIQILLAPDQIVKNISRSEDNKCLACVVYEQSSYKTYVFDVTTGKIIIIIDCARAICFNNNILYYGTTTGKIFSKKCFPNELENEFLSSEYNSIHAISVNNAGNMVFCTDRIVYVYKNKKLYILKDETETDNVVDVYMLPTQDKDRMVLFVVKHNRIEGYKNYMHYFNVNDKKYSYKNLCFTDQFTSYKATPDGKTLVLAKAEQGQYFIVNVRKKEYTIVDRSPYSCCIFNENGTKCIEMLKTQKGIEYYHSSPYTSKKNEDCIKNYLKTTQLKNLFLLHSIMSNNKEYVSLRSDYYSVYKNMPIEVQKKVEFSKSIKLITV